MQGFVALGFTNSLAWRYSMVIPGAAMILMGFIYYKFTQDTPEGNFSDIKRNSEEGKKSLEPINIMEVLKDRRIWILFFIYGCSFGVEITIDNIAALYFKRHLRINFGNSRNSGRNIRIHEYFRSGARWNYQRQGKQNQRITGENLGFGNLPLSCRTWNSHVLEYDWISHGRCFTDNFCVVR